MSDGLTVRWRVEWDTEAAKQLTNNVGDFVRSVGSTQGLSQLFRPIAQRMERALISATPVSSGAMKAGWELHQHSVPKGVGFTIENKVPHTAFVLMGTGLYGPKHAWIKPKTRQFMTFTYQGKNFRLRQVRGQRKNTVLLNTINNLAQDYDTVTGDLVNNWVGAHLSKSFGRTARKGTTGSGLTTRMAAFKAT